MLLVFLSLPRWRVPNHLHPCCFNNLIWLCTFNNLMMWILPTIEISLKIIFRWWAGNHERSCLRKCCIFMVACKSHCVFEPPRFFFLMLRFLNTQGFLSEHSGFHFWMHRVLFWSFALNISHNLFIRNLFTCIFCFIKLWKQCSF